MKQDLPVGTLVACLFLAGCQPSTFVKPIPELAKVSPPASLAGRSPAMVSFTSLFIDIPAGTALGQSTWGYAGSCSDAEPIVARRGASELKLGIYQEVFNEVMASAGVPVQQVQARFEGEEIRKAELQIAATIKDMALNICYPKKFQDSSLAVGESYLQIAWDVFSPVEKRIVHSTVTSGRTDGKLETRLAEVGILKEAFRNAALKLMDDAVFVSALIDKPPVTTAVATATRRSLAQRTVFDGSVNDNLESIRGGVVTIFANSGQGSGFAIGDGDLIVTAAHVTSGSRIVKVVGAAKQAHYGEVVAADAVRDVALIKLEGARFRPLPLASEPPKQGVEIYVIGSPLHEDFSFTVTKGIVSGVRTIEKLDYIQGDVTVLPGHSGGPLLDAHGNVIGVAVNGVAIHGAPVGMNFFVPVRDVFRSLALQEQASR